MPIPLSWNVEGFASEYLTDIEYDRWDIYFGFDFGSYRIQIGNLRVDDDGYVDFLMPIRHNSDYIFFNLLEKNEKGVYIYWNRYDSILEALRGMKSLMVFQDYTGESGKPYREYKVKMEFDEIPF